MGARLGSQILIERLEQGILRIPFCDCWLFVEAGRENRNGYGRMNWKGKELMAHRLSYEAHVGPIPDGLLLEHKCRMRCCVNPHHLEPVTVKVNTWRGEAKLFGFGRDPRTYQTKSKSSKIVIPTTLRSDYEHRRYDRKARS